MSIVKYRLKEVAADLGITPKEVSEILSRFFEKPKSNTQVLTGEELNVVFDCVTRAPGQSRPRRQSPRVPPLLRRRPRASPPPNLRSPNASGSAGSWTPPPSR